MVRLWLFLIFTTNKILEQKNRSIVENRQQKINIVENRQKMWGRMAIRPYDVLISIERSL
ncbi:hypothetical protein [Hydrocoleum sp. CS-953]|uniref:hypothetical protein n=1 Tax=Hydrocoleum sp. CS-953 TaxID=1671698 RepID=UPI00117A37F3|nr:hypothetical protein [Hydrocoleum sp. CS-953]